MKSNMSYFEQSEKEVAKMMVKTKNLLLSALDTIVVRLLGLTKREILSELVLVKYQWALHFVNSSFASIDQVKMSSMMESLKENNHSIIMMMTVVYYKYNADYDVSQCMVVARTGTIKSRERENVCVCMFY